MLIDVGQLLYDITVARIVLRREAPKDVAGIENPNPVPDGGAKCSNEGAICSECKLNHSTLY